MPLNDQYSTICSQILSPSDLKLSRDALERLHKEKVVVTLSSKKGQTYIKIHSLEPIYLSKIAPILSALAFNVINEVAYNFTIDKSNIYINRFNLDIDDAARLNYAKDNIIHVISDALRGISYPECHLYSLIYLQNISIREVTLLRGLIVYLNQAILTINEQMFLDILIKHHKITKLFLQYFYTKFFPEKTKRSQDMKTLEKKIEEMIKAIPNVMDDKILKYSYDLLKNITRTNYYSGREAIAVKINTKEFSSNLKGLQPHLEMFVYHPKFSGLHLRMTPISRGGLRWSERHEDFRQEVKSLMITQEGKNSIIVPSGAKGAFVINKEKREITKGVFEKYYSDFINNLLDLVDNKVDNKVVSNPTILRYDEDDTYFVVAADKGTASMSDVANSISLERGFWLGDAFASGSSNGYSHKKLGITAKGSFKSTQRFFIEKGIDFYKEPITIVGIGSMNGDVFGNGIQLSKKFKLIGAVSHREIFIDPNPNPEVSHKERARLFEEQDGSWSMYNSNLISKGGGIFERNQKSIELTTAIQKLLSTTRKSMSGEELAQKLLITKVDLLFNGGVGTYVKSSEENNIDIGDKQNEGVRIDASTLQAFAVCEGGNLGFTQKARIEYALNGGKINLDGIDNSAGVNISDHEVNLKILLNHLEKKGLLDTKDKTKTLKEMTDQIVNKILWNNYSQSLAISLDEHRSTRKLDEFLNTIHILEEHLTQFKRHDFFIPKDENIQEILTKNGGIVRPVLASLLSYSKIFIKKMLLKSNFINDSFALNYIYKYFPKSFIAVYEHEITDHPLVNEIVATIIADKVINLQGVTFINSYEEAKYGKFITKIKSYLIGNQLFGANDIRFEIYRNDYNMPSHEQYSLLFEIEESLSFSTKWMLKYLLEHQIDPNYILDYQTALFNILEKQPVITKRKTILENNDKVNQFFSVLDYLRFSVAAISIKEGSIHPFDDIAQIFYLVITRFSITELIEALDDITLTSQIEKYQKRQLYQFIEYIVVHFTHKIIEFQRLNENAAEAFENYLSNESMQFKQIQKELDHFDQQGEPTLSDITVTVNQLMAAAI